MGFSVNSRKWFLVALVCMASTLAGAHPNDFRDGWIEGQRVGKKQLPEIESALTHFTVEKDLPGFSSTPAQSEYQSDDVINEASKKAFKENTISQTIVTSKNTRPNDYPSLIDIQSAEQTAIDAKTHIEKQDPIFCLNASCQTLESSPNQDFEQAVTQLTAARKAGEAMDKPAVVFGGEAIQCREYGYHFSNCCQKAGWGQNLHLADCRDKEKELSIARRDKLAVFVDNYCAKHFSWPLHGCKKRLQVYCVFKDRLAYILQSQGRRFQLHHSFGTGEYPDCSGLSAADLQHLDFANINFETLYQDLHSQLTFHDEDTVKNTIAAKVNALQSEASDVSD